MNNLYITGAGVSAASGIPTFRGSDGYWTKGSVNYTPMDICRQSTYMKDPMMFLTWYYERFAKYKDAEPNEVHYYLAGEKLITQNIDCLDERAGNMDYIPIHGRMDRVYVWGQKKPFEFDWNAIDKNNLEESIGEAFKLKYNPQQKRWFAKKNQSLKPMVLLFDEYYDEERYKVNTAYRWIDQADRVIFIGTSFSVAFPDTALYRALSAGKKVVIVDPRASEIKEGLHDIPWPMKEGIKTLAMDGKAFVYAIQNTDNLLNDKE